MEGKGHTATEEKTPFSLLALWWPYLWVLFSLSLAGMSPMTEVLHVPCLNFVHLPKSTRGIRWLTVPIDQKLSVHP